MNHFTFLILKGILQRTLLNQEHSDLWRYLIQGSGDHWHVTGEFHYLVGQSGERLRGKIPRRVNLSDIGINSSSVDVFACAHACSAIFLLTRFVAQSFFGSLARSGSHSAGRLTLTFALLKSVCHVCVCPLTYRCIQRQACHICLDHKQDNAFLRHLLTCFMLHTSKHFMCVLLSSSAVKQRVGLVTPNSLIICLLQQE